VGDYILENYKQAGLLLPTRFRAKFATISWEIVDKKLGSLSIDDRTAVSASIRDVLAFV